MARKLSRVLGKREEKEEGKQERTLQREGEGELSKEQK